MKLIAKAVDFKYVRKRTPRASGQMSLGAKTGWQGCRLHLFSSSLRFSETTLIYDIIDPVKKIILQLLFMLSLIRITWKAFDLSVNSS